MTTPTYRGAQPNIAQAEPVTIGGGILVLGNLIIGGLPLFTDALTAEQVGYLNLVFSAVVALATAIIRQGGQRVHPQRRRGGEDRGPPGDRRRGLRASHGYTYP